VSQLSQDFQQRAKIWLSRYKREVLNVYEDGIWLRNRRAYSHILPIAERRLNVLSTIRDEFWKWFSGRGIRLHSDFHHLNSSQALCFNLFFPLIMYNDAEGMSALLAALGLTGTPAGGGCFEFEPNASEGTSFDFMLPLSTGSRIYFEIKYTESAFGSAKADEEHLRKFESVYKPMVGKRFENSFCSPDGFLRHYQILRNLVYLNAGSDDLALFLIPKANRSLARSESVIRSCAVQPFRSQVRIVYLEELITKLQSELKRRGTRHDMSLEEFCLKYLTPIQARPS
jgi:hypothetical protein